MKRRARPLIALSLLLIASLSIACGAGTNPRGWAAPVASGQVLLVSTGRGHLDGIDADTGRALWRFPDDWELPDGKGRLQGIYGNPVLNSDGSVVFVGDYNGIVYAFRPSQGSNGGGSRPRAAALEFDGAIIGGIALDQAGTTLFVAAGDSLYAVRAADLVNRIESPSAAVTVARLLQTGGELWGSPVVSDGRVFAPSVDGNLYAVEQSSGRTLWKFATPRSLVSTPALAGGALLVGSFDNKLHAVDAASGTSRWQFDATDWVWSRPAIDGSRAYFGDFKGIVYGVDLASGSRAWAFALGRGAIRSGPVLAGNMLVVATNDGWLAGIDKDTRVKAWETKVDANFTADLVLQGGRVLITPTRCITLPGTSERVYYYSVDPSNGQLEAAAGVC